MSGSKVVPTESSSLSLPSAGSVTNSSHNHSNEETSSSRFQYPEQHSSLKSQHRPTASSLSSMMSTKESLKTNAPAMIRPRLSQMLRSTQALNGHHRSALRHLPFDLHFNDDCTKKYSIHDWIHNLDAIIEGCKNDHFRSKQPQECHKRSLSCNDVQTSSSTTPPTQDNDDPATTNYSTSSSTTASPPRRKRQRRNSFVIHRNHLGQNVSLLNSLQEVANTMKDDDSDSEAKEEDHHHHYSHEDIKESN